MNIGTIVKGIKDYIRVLIREFMDPMIIKLRDSVIDLSLNCQVLLNLLKEKNIISDKEFTEKGIEMKKEFNRQMDLDLLYKMKEDLT